MEFIKQCKAVAQASSAKIVFPEGNVKRILQASRYLLDESIANVILLGEHAEILETAEQSNIALDDIETVDPKTSELLADYTERYISNRPRTKPAVASRIVSKPLGFGAMMVKAGEADLMVAGVSHPTRRVIEAAGACIGLADGISIPSSFFFMNFADRAPLIFADCAVNVDPSPSELADIAISTAINAERLLGVPAKVALLSFSTKGSASHSRVNKVQQALDIAGERAPELNIDGELQVDSALIPSVAAQKVKGSSTVAGEANVLIFPDLDAANIGYKLVRHLAHAEAIGPILQGFSLPVADLSRGASVDEIINTSIVSMALR
jgi:phosphate acetyltransferase